MSLGQWAAALAGDDADLQAMLTDVPGEMCPKIDAWTRKSSRYRYNLTAIGRRSSYSDDESGVDSLYSDAERVIAERDAMVDGLEDCRTALAALRDALVNAVELIKEMRRGAHEGAGEKA